MGVNRGYLSYHITIPPLVTYHLYLGMFVYIFCMWFVIFDAKSSRKHHNHFLSHTMRASGTAYYTRTAGVRRYICRIYTQNARSKRALLQFLHVIHKCGHHAFDLRVLVVFSIIVCVVQESFHRVCDISLI